MIIMMTKVTAKYDGSYDINHNDTNDAITLLMIALMTITLKQQYINECKLKW